MKKRIAVLVTLIVVFSCLLSGCGGSGTSADTGAADTGAADTGSEEGADKSESGLFSVVGGWRSEGENGSAVLLFADDGTGVTLSEIQYKGDVPDMDLPSHVKTEFTWKEDVESVTVATSAGDYVFQKIKDGDNEKLDSNGFAYGRLSEEETKEYREKAASIESAGQTQEAADSRNEEIVMEEPITVIDNDLVKISVTRFFREVFNEGTDNEFLYAGFEIEAENKTDGYELSIYPEDCSFSDRRVIEFGGYKNGNRVAPGKIATMLYVRQDNEDFENLESLYELEGNFNISVSKDNKYINDLSGKQAFSIPEARRTDLTPKAEEPEEGEDTVSTEEGENTASTEEGEGSEISEEEIDEQLQGEWVLNAGSGGVFGFDDGVMTVEANGMTLTGTYEINVEDSTVDGHFQSNEGKTVTIHMPYKIDEDGNLVLMNNANVELLKK